VRPSRSQPLLIVGDPLSAESRPERGTGWFRCFESSSPANKTGGQRCISGDTTRRFAVRACRLARAQTATVLIELGAMTLRGPPDYDRQEPDWL
jgi:hypothetical protein